MNARHRKASRVLLVDDDDFVRRIAAQSLEHLGFSVVELADARSALELLERSGSDIQLIVSDVRMPGLQGDELARIVSQRWPDLPVLLTSGHARTGDFTDGDVRYEVLAKPFSQAQLARAIVHVKNEMKQRRRHSAQGV